MPAGVKDQGEMLQLYVDTSTIPCPYPFQNKPQFDSVNSVLPTTHNTAFFAPLWDPIFLPIFLIPKIAQTLREPTMEIESAR
ncbi:hypothetical protein HN51_038535 [Arachis hypogaea]